MRPSPWLSVLRLPNHANVNKLSDRLNARRIITPSKTIMLFIFLYILYDINNRDVNSGYSMTVFTVSVSKKVEIRHRKCFDI